MTMTPELVAFAESVADWYTAIDAALSTELLTDSLDHELTGEQITVYRCPHCKRVSSVRGNCSAGQGHGRREELTAMVRR